MRNKLAIMALTVPLLLSAGCGASSDSSTDDEVVVRYSSGDSATYSQLVERMRAVPDMMSCETALKMGKEAGDTYPAGEAKFLAACKEGKGKK